jgi:hypothetical protein
LYYYLPAYAYAKSSGGGSGGKMQQDIVYATSIDLDESSNLRINIPGMYEVTVVGQMFNENADLFINIKLDNTGLDSTISASQWFAQNSLTLLFNVTTVPVSLIVALTSSSIDHNHSSWTTVKWISQVSDSQVSSTSANLNVIQPGVIANTTIVNYYLYYYLPAYAYAKSSGGGSGGIMQQNIVYAKSIDLDESKSLKILVPGYYEITVVGQMFNEGADLFITVEQWENSALVKSDSTISASQYFAQNRLTKIIKCTNVPSYIVVKLTSSSIDHNHNSWTTVKWISM